MIIRLKSTTKMTTTAESIAVAHGLGGRNCPEPQNKNAVPNTIPFSFSPIGRRKLNCNATYEEPININAPPSALRCSRVEVNALEASDTSSVPMESSAEIKSIVLSHRKIVAMSVADHRWV